MGMFAAAPPTEALRFIVSHVAGWNRDDQHDRAFMTCDIFRALFHAPAGPHTFVDIPEEDKEQSETYQDSIGTLRLALSGIGEAAAAWAGWRGGRRGGREGSSSRAWQQGKGKSGQTYGTCRA